MSGSGMGRALVLSLLIAGGSALGEREHVPLSMLTGTGDRTPGAPCDQDRTWLPTDFYIRMGVELLRGGSHAATARDDQLVGPNGLDVGCACRLTRTGTKSGSLIGAVVMGARDRPGKATPQYLVVVVGSSTAWEWQCILSGLRAPDEPGWSILALRHRFDSAALLILLRPAGDGSPWGSDVLSTVFSVVHPKSRRAAVEIREVLERTIGSGGIGGSGAYERHEHTLDFTPIARGTARAIIHSEINEFGPYDSRAQRETIRTAWTWDAAAGVFQPDHDSRSFTTGPADP